MTRFLLVPLAAAGIALSTGACTPIGGNGELGNGTFSYNCSSDSDPVCDGSTDFNGDHVPPKAVAVGSRFSMRYTPRSLGGDDPGGSTTLTAASPEIFGQTGTLDSSFKALEPGLGAILAKRGDTVADFTHLRASAIDHVQVDQVDGQFGAASNAGIDELTLSMLAVSAIRAFPVDEADATLGGALSATWTSSDESVVSFDTLASDNQVSIRGEKAGTATLHVDLGGQSADVVVTVEGAQ